MINKKAFTLIELLVVVAIIGILAAVGVVAYNGYTASAKASATKANLKLVTKFVSTEVMKCVLGEAYIMEKTIDCSQTAGSLFVYNDAVNLKGRVKIYFDGKLTNPYTGGKGVVGSGAVPNADNEVGEVRMHSQSTVPERINFMICFKLPCSDANNRSIETVILPE